jgi:hypothetical protein
MEPSELTARVSVRTLVAKAGFPVGTVGKVSAKEVKGVSGETVMIDVGGGGIFYRADEVEAV